MNWTSIDEILPVINDARSKNGSWQWYRNSRCKYISLQIDMRDGHCVIMDSDGEVITLDQLKLQAKFKGE